MTVRMRGFAPLGLAMAAAMNLSVGSVAAQRAEIAFGSDLPRTLVFIAEDGQGDVATRDLTDFLREAGFPLVDPALAHTAAQRDLVQSALDGDEGAAVQLGRDFGAHVLIIGVADWGARPDPVDGTLVTATSEVSIRALRLDRGHVVAAAQSNSRAIEATEQAARTKAIRQATAQLLETSPLLGQLMNDWESTPWEEQAYWSPDPGSVGQQVQETRTDAGVAAPGLAILMADVRPATGGGQTRGLGVVKRGERSASLFNPVRLEGVVVGETRSVTVEGKPANLEPLDPQEAASLGLGGQQAQRFWAETTLPMSRDSVRVVATGPSGSESHVVAAPRIDQRWAVVIGVGQYASAEIPDLEFAEADARSVYDFLRSDAAGPFEEDHVLLLTDENATAAKMREALFVFLQQADWDDLVFIYYAGHGAPDPARPDNLYLLPHDSDIDALAATAFPMWDVKTALRRQIAAERVIVIADACHAAGTADDAAVGGSDQNAIAGSFAELFTPSRRLMMTAADTNEFSLEDARWGGHGVFTHFMLEALEGKGDLNGDGIITFAETYEHVSRSVVSATQGRQNPQRAGIGDVPLAVVGVSGPTAGIGGGQ